MNRKLFVLLGTIFFLISICCAMEKSSSSSDMEESSSSSDDDNKLSNQFSIRRVGGIEGLTKYCRQRNSEDSKRQERFIIETKEYLSDLEEAIPAIIDPIGSSEPDRDELSEELSDIDEWIKKLNEKEDLCKHVCSYALGRKYFNMDKIAPLGSDFYNRELVRDLIKLIVYGVIKLRLNAGSSPDFQLREDSSPRYKSIDWRGLYDNLSFPSILISCLSGGRWIETSDPYNLEKKIEQSTELFCEFIGFYSVSFAAKQFVMPKSISSLKNLETVYISNASEISPELFKLKQLKTLRINQSEEAIFSYYNNVALGDGSGITELNLDNNNLAAIPHAVYSLTTLKVLSLKNEGSDKLTSISPQISKLSSLSALDLSHNQLASLPLTISMLYALKKLRLSFNKNITLPMNISNCAQIRLLDLSYNDLLEIPEPVFLLANLDCLNCCDNKLNWISSKISKLTNLESLDLNRNDISELPKAMTIMRNLKKLTLTKEPHGLLGRFVSAFYNTNKYPLLGVTYSVQEWHQKHPSLFS